MDNQHYSHPMIAAIYLFVSILGTIYAWISMASAREVIGIVAGIISIGAGIMAIRYYYHSIKEIKKKRKIQ